MNYGIDKNVAKYVPKNRGKGGAGDRTACERDKTSDLTGKYFKIALINMFMEQRESMTKK